MLEGLDQVGWESCGTHTYGTVHIFLTQLLRILKLESLPSAWAPAQCAPHD